MLIPAKAAVLNLLSIGAALGVITFIFQDGHLASLFGVHTTSPVEPFMPVMLFAIIFGLSMDPACRSKDRRSRRRRATRGLGRQARTKPTL